MTKRKADRAPSPRVEADCRECGKRFSYLRGGRPGIHCSTSCKNKAYRQTAAALKEAEQLGSLFID